VDAFADPGFCLALAEAMRDDSAIEDDALTIHCSSTRLLRAWPRA
jgi:hypothetical protein